MFYIFCITNARIRFSRKWPFLILNLPKKLYLSVFVWGIFFFPYDHIWYYFQEDGATPLHFDERDIISCVFHLGKLTSGGSTSYYSGSSPMDPGRKIYHVPFNHGTLQIGFFNKILHGVDEWEGQRCGIQLNIKKDVLTHFVRYGKFFLWQVPSDRLSTRTYHFLISTLR